MAQCHKLVFVRGRTMPQASWTTGLMLLSRSKSRCHSRTLRRVSVPFYVKSPDVSAPQVPTPDESLS